MICVRCERTLKRPHPHPHPPSSGHFRSGGLPLRLPTCLPASRPCLWSPGSPGHRDTNLFISRRGERGEDGEGGGGHQGDSPRAPAAFLHGTYNPAGPAGCHSGRPCHPRLGPPTQAHPRPHETFGDSKLFVFTLSPSPSPVPIFKSTF